LRVDGRAAKRYIGEDRYLGETMFGNGHVPGTYSGRSLAGSATRLEEVAGKHDEDHRSIRAEISEEHTRLNTLTAAREAPGGSGEVARPQQRIAYRGTQR